MRTYLVVGIVVLAHCVAVGSAFLIQGCGTMTDGHDGAAPEPVAVVMPPSAEPAPQPATILVPPSPEDAGMTADVVSTETITYVVKKGDSLSRIARSHGLSTAQVATMNGIKNANMVKVGQRLLLPAAGAAAPVAPHENSRTERVAAAPAGGTYVVKKGDSLSRIAVAQGTTVKALKEANGLKSDLIVAGRELVIPGGVTARKAPAHEVDMRPPAPVEPDISIDTRVPPAESRVGGAEQRSAVKTEPRAAKATPPMKSRIVLEGEDLNTIAQQWGLSAEELRRINNLGDEPVKPGQVLKIPLGEF